MLTPPEKYEKFNVGARPMRMREYTTMNNKYIYSHILHKNIHISSAEDQQGLFVFRVIGRRSPLNFCELDEKCLSNLISL